MIAAHVVNAHNKRLYESDIVAYIKVSEAALASVRKILRINHSLFIRRGLQPSFVKIAKKQLEAAPEANTSSTNGASQRWKIIPTA